MNTSDSDAIAKAVATQVAKLFEGGDIPIAPEYLTAAQVRQLTGFSEKTLESFRARRIGPPFLKVGKNVRYRATDVRAWIEQGGGN